MSESLYLTVGRSNPVVQQSFVEKQPSEAEQIAYIKAARALSRHLYVEGLQNTIFDDTYTKHVDLVAMILTTKASVEGEIPADRSICLVTTGLDDQELATRNLSLPELVYMCGSCALIDQCRVGSSVALYV